MLLVEKMDKELITAAIGKYLEELAINATEAETSPRLRSPRPATDIDGFFRLVGQVIQKQQEVEGVTKPLTYSEDFPEKDDNIEGEVITYCVKQRKPGVFEQVPVSQAMSPRRSRARVKMFREALDDPDNAGMKIYTYGQEYDNIVLFKIWAKTNKTANRRAIWFESLIEEWRWFFQASGVKHVYFEERGEDMHLSPENRKLVCRPLSFYVRTEKVSTVREYSLRSLVVDSST
jgi:hypothetical protein